MCANDRMGHRRHGVALRLRHRLFTVAARARKVEVMDRAQIRDALLPLRVEALVGAVHVAEFRLSSLLGYYLRIEHRGLPGPVLPRSVLVPGECAAIGMATARLALRV